MGDLELFIGRLMPFFDEKERRLFLGALIDYLGHGSLKKVQEITGISHVTLIAGKKQVQSLAVDSKARAKASENKRVRKEGAGRRNSTDIYPQLKQSLLELLDGNTIGNPNNPLCWTTKSLRNLQASLASEGIHISHVTIKQLLEDLGFSLQQNKKYIEHGEPHPDRDAQFQFINGLCKEFIEGDQPVISVDTKKKELIGNYKNNGAEYNREKSPVLVLDHDFAGPDGKACPYGIYDINRNEGFVNVGISADTGEFAVNSIRTWWNMMGKERYPNATKILITADGGGSNGRRNKLWKKCLQQFATENQLEIHVSHFPAGTSKWNKIEHRMFCFISKNWRGRPLRTLATIVSLIASTKTKGGLKVACNVDLTTYEKAQKVLDSELTEVTKKDWHGEWNYVIHPSLPTLLPTPNN